VEIRKSSRFSWNMRPKSVLKPWGGGKSLTPGGHRTQIPRPSSPQPKPIANSAISRSRISQSNWRDHGSIARKSSTPFTFSQRQERLENPPQSPTQILQGGCFLGVNRLDRESNDTPHSNIWRKYKYTSLPKQLHFTALSYVSPRTTSYFIFI
jgi:hypothetical protein